MKVAIIGSTGLVGTEIIKILEKQKKPKIEKLILVASKKNIGTEITYKNKKKKIISISEAIKQKPEYALFSAGSDVALKYAKSFSKKGTIVIDNSSAFRMDKKTKLIVPEINKEIITKKDTIISNPNCSTIQLVLAINQIHQKLKIKRLIISTYQAVSGTGHAGIKQLESEERNQKPKATAYKKNIHRNVIPKCDAFSKNGYTKEEEKIINETNKILNSKIKITATAVRVPTIGGHGESVNVETEKTATIKQLIKILKNQKGILVQEGKEFKTPSETKGKNTVYVSRIRKDETVKAGFNMWIVADPLRKGAATNAIQILNHIYSLKNLS